MPFNTVSEFQKSFPSIKSLTPAQKRVALNVFNSAKDRGFEDGRAIAQAIGAAKKRASEKKLAENLPETIRILSEITFEESIGDKWFEVLRAGEHYDGRYGKFNITPKNIQELAENFKNNVVGTQLALDENHDPNHKAVAWLSDVKAEGNSLYVKLKDFSSRGREYITEKIYKYFSVEFMPEFKKAVNGTVKIFKNVLRGVALTNRPVIKTIAPTFLSESLINNNIMSSLRTLLSDAKAKDSITGEDYEVLEVLFVEASAEEKTELQPEMDEAAEKVEESTEETTEETTESTEETTEEAPAEAEATEETSTEETEEEAKEEEATEETSTEDTEEKEEETEEKEEAEETTEAPAEEEASDATVEASEVKALAEKLAEDIAKKQLSELQSKLDIVVSARRR